ncbi:hypothetical protein HPP92_008356 [Vanilla planifolia]|uniref:DDHD domain-containing protein n=1 Tax=Vanilla planifolia TaxID=51239 RepID=A0A835R5V3_VANPL|nr:hypothetical protein HPP92_008356 [Vanilla planifolia]
MESSGSKCIGKKGSEKITSTMAAVPDQVEGASPDLLQNTPSNIAKLEDLIEQCKGRQKYLAQSRSPSDGEDVRWYFCKVPLAEKELAASVPQTEVVGKSDYFRFSVRDSLALEASFLQREEELLAYWWKEYAECNEGPKGSCSCSETWDDHGLYFVEEDRVGVPVKGGLYEVDLTRRHCFPVYWNGENRRVLRGHWFARKGGTDWLPMKTFQSSWSWLTVVRCGIGEHFSLQACLLPVLICKEKHKGNWVKLRRGFQPSGSVKPTQVPVGHLVFMVHGIGQRLEKANLVDDVGDFRRVTASLAERHLTPYQRSTQRVLFILARTWIDTSMIYEVNIKIHGIMTRVKLLQTRIVALEQKGHSSLLENNVDFSKENFSVNALHTVGHCKDQSNLEKSGQDASRKRYTPYIRYTKLDFKVDTFFAVGSPLGVFLALRNIRIGIGRGQDYWQDENISEEMPACCQMFNIFHPFDPVAYSVYLVMVIAVNSCEIEVVEDDNESEQSYGYLMIDRLTGNRHGRVDHVLQDKTFQHPYISALGSHTTCIVTYLKTLLKDQVILHH